LTVVPALLTIGTFPGAMKGVVVRRGEEGEENGAPVEPSGYEPEATEQPEKEGEDVGVPTDQPDDEVPSKPPESDEDVGAADALHPDVTRRRLHFAMGRAVQMGLIITSTNKGSHAPGSYHYRQPFHTFVLKGRRYELGRAIDIGRLPGTPLSRFAEYFHAVEGMQPTEMFFDPIGYYWKNQRKVQGAIGGHGDHVHVAF
jgi:hypothetical protein